MTRAESCLVVLVPEAEALVKPCRDKHDPSAAAGMPAHVTLLYPFLAPNRITAAVLDELRFCLTRFPAFGFTFGDIGRFPGVFYLAPEPDDPFRALTMAIWNRYPETPPYGGRHADIIPHLSVAQLDDEGQLDLVAEAFRQEAAGQLPIRGRASEVALMENVTGSWQTHSTFFLGGG